MNLEGFKEKVGALGVLGVVVTQDGEEKAKYFWEEEYRRNIYSASKSFTSCAVGFAVQEGLISLDEKLVDAFADDLPEEVSENLAKATVKDLLTMCLGQEKGGLMGGQRPQYKEEDWVKMSLAIPFVYEPGTHFVYNNVGPYLAGILVQRRSGCRDLVDYLMPRLFRPLGIRRPTWECDPMGLSFGAGGLFLTLSELHKLGLLYLQKRLLERQTAASGRMDHGEHEEAGGKQPGFLRLWLPVLGRPGGHVPRGRQVLPALDHLQGEKCSHQSRVRVP